MEFDKAIVVHVKTLQRAQFGHGHRDLFEFVAIET